MQTQADLRGEFAGIGFEIDAGGIHKYVCLNARINNNYNRHGVDS